MKDGDDRVRKYTVRYWNNQILLAFIMDSPDNNTYKAENCASSCDFLTWDLNDFLKSETTDYEIFNDDKTVKHKAPPNPKNLSDRGQCYCRLCTFLQDTQYRQ